jgi:hypothetical protein
MRVEIKRSELFQLKWHVMPLGTSCTVQPDGNYLASTNLQLDGARRLLDLGDLGERLPHDVTLPCC